jgi:AcrR family transcriptional regulator
LSHEIVCTVHEQRGVHPQGKQLFLPGSLPPFGVQVNAAVLRRLRRYDERSVATAEGDALVVRTAVDVRIENAALDILRTRGPLAVTIEAVSHASGVAKTTIYRRHENRSSLLRAIVYSSSTSMLVPEGLTAYEMLHWFLGHARDTIDNVVGRGTVAALLVGDDPEFTGLILGMIRTRSQPLRDALRERMASGELRDSIDIELLISLLLGTFMAESIRGKSTGEGWADEVLGLLWPALKA